MAAASAPTSTVGLPLLGNAQALGRATSAAPEFGKKSNPNATLPAVASTAAVKALRRPFHLLSPKPSGVDFMLDDLSTTSKTLTALGAAASLVPPQSVGASP